MPFWLIHLLAAATALALAEHWLRYALVERKRARRVAARLERIRRGRERREREADDREWAAYLARKAEPRLAESLYAQMQAEQMRATQGVGTQEAQNMAVGLDPAEQNGGAGAQWPSYVADLSAGPVRHVSTAAECRCIFCQRATGRYETGTGPFP